MKETRAEYLHIEKLRPFEGHPFKVIDNEEMVQLVWSILTQGLLTPLVVRSLPSGEYEVVSGHRRLHACKKAGIETVPTLITDMDRDTATIALVDSNLHREKILPSEKAYAYKMKAEALAHQGWRSDLTSGQVVPKSDDNRTTAQIGADVGDSYKTVQRYIRLTNLIPEILQYVDEGRIAFTPAVELSYLNDQEQYDLWEQMELNDCTPSLSQACRLKKISQEEGLTPEVIVEIMSEEKANQREMFKVPMDRIRKYVPSGRLHQAEDFVLKACEYYHRYLLRQRDRDER